jgi:AraC-like DNA-binding protein/Ser/Thr protein kinase RdoA (MazF antagonist)
MYMDAIQAVVDYIEANLKTDISTDELAAIASYSKYHFYSVFGAVIGMPVAGYILHRRLKHALCEIAGGRTAAEVMLEYGFDTYAGFYKAFVREYGCSPKKYVAIYGSGAAKSQKLEVTPMHQIANMDVLKNIDRKKILSNWDVDVEAAERSGSHFMLMGYNEEEAISNLLKRLTISKALKERGFSSGLPLQAKNGEYYVRDKEIVFTLTDENANPTTLNKIDINSPNYPEIAAECGRSIGNLHSVLLDLEDELICDDMDMYRRMADWALPEVRKINQQWSMGLADSFFEEWLTEFAKLHPQLPRQIIHRDPNPQKVVVDDTEFSYFMFSELLERNVRLFDPCYCATGVLSELPDLGQFDKWLEIASAILGGYDEVAHLTEAEKRSVYYVMTGISMIFIAWGADFNDKNMKQLNKRNRDILGLLVANKDKIETLLK